MNNKYILHHSSLNKSFLFRICLVDRLNLYIAFILFFIWLIFLDSIQFKKRKEKRKNRLTTLTFCYWVIIIWTRIKRNWTIPIIGCKISIVNFQWTIIWFFLKKAYKIFDGKVKINVGIAPESWLLWSWLYIFLFWEGNRNDYFFLQVD